jgi:hypothetical protein
MPGRVLQAGLLALCLAAPMTGSFGVGTAAPDRDVPGRARRADGVVVAAASPEVRDPLFELLIGIAEGDSLGVWETPALAARVTVSGRPTHLPLDRIRRVERRAVIDSASAESGGLRPTRRWRLSLDEDLAFPMPYSILGYHPGTLRFSREIVLSEWRLGAANLRLARDDSARVFPYAGIVCWRLDAGWLVLDADGWVDRLLGSALDDSWTEGLALGRLDGRLVGLALGVNRDLRRLMGEFDFREDKVFPNGRPAARVLTGFCRSFVAPPPGLAPRAWQGGP